MKHKRGRHEVKQSEIPGHVIGRGHRCYQCLERKRLLEVGGSGHWAGFADSMCVLSHFSHGQLFATPSTARLPGSSVQGFFKLEYWSGSPCPPPGDLLNPGTQPFCLLRLPHWQAGSLPPAPPGKPWRICRTWKEQSKEVSQGEEQPGKEGKGVSLREACISGKKRSWSERTPEATY